MLTRVQDVEVEGSVTITGDITLPPRVDRGETEDASIRQAIADGDALAARVAALEARSATMEAQLATLGL